MTNTRLTIEEAPYKLRVRGRNFEVLLSDGTPIGSVQPLRRMSGRQSIYGYVPKSETGRLLSSLEGGGVQDLDDAADKVYDYWLKTAPSSSAPSLERGAEYVARLYVSGAFAGWSSAVAALDLWAGVFEVPLAVSETPTVLDKAKRRVEGR